MGIVRLTMSAGSTDRLQATIFSIKNFYQLLKQFETTLTQSIREILISRGVEKGSDLVKSLDVGYSNDLFQILANDYYQYVSRGRRPRARKVPIEALIEWIKDSGITYRGSINNAAFAIQQAIYKKGIQGKLFEESVLDFSGSLISDVSAEELANWSLWGLIQVFQVLEDGKWITVSFDFRQPKYAFNYQAGDVKFSSGVKYEEL